MDVGTDGDLVARGTSRLDFLLGSLQGSLKPIDLFLRRNQLTVDGVQRISAEQPCLPRRIEDRLHLRTRRLVPKQDVAVKLNRRFRLSQLQGLRRINRIRRRHHRATWLYLRRLSPTAPNRGDDNHQDHQSKSDLRLHG